jgi:molybdenum cofactor cytidylyltransferase
MQGILLAAGNGRRFQTEIGAGQDKLLAHFPDDDKPILWHSASALITALPNSIAVIQPQQTERKALLQDLGFTVIESLAAEQGMGYAIADAVKSSVDAAGWLIALADMPWVSADLINQVIIRVGNQNDIVAPRFNGKRGQPVAFGSTWVDQLKALEGDIGARELLKVSLINYIDWKDDSILRDVDTRIDLLK